MTRLNQTHALAATAFGISLVLYLITLAPSITPGDSAEMTVAGISLQVPHSPGYPLTTLIYRLSTILWTPDPGRAANLLSAFLAALSIALLYALALRVLKHPLIALSAAILFAIAPGHWALSLTAGVFPLATLLGIATLWSWVRARDEQTAPAYWLAAYLSGLAAIAHWTNLLLLPGMLILTVGKRGVSRGFLYAPVFFLLGLSPAATLLARARHLPAGEGADLSQFGTWWQYVTLRGGDASFGSRALLDGGAPATSAISWDGVVGSVLGESVRHFLEVIVEPFGAAFAMVVLFGVLFALRRSVREGLALLALLLFTGPFLVSLIGPRNDPIAQDELVRFCRLTYAVCVLGFCAGLIWIGVSMSKFDRAAGVALPSLFFIGGVVFILLQAFTQANRGRDRIALDLGGDILGMLPPGSTLLVDEDDHRFSVLYQQYGLGKRRDVQVLDMRELGSDGEMNDIASLKAPLYATSLAATNAFSDRDAIPHGIVYRLVPPSQSSWIRKEIGTARERRRLTGFRSAWTGSQGRYLKALYHFFQGEDALFFTDRGRSSERGAGSEAVSRRAMAYYRLAGMVGQQLPKVHHRLGSRYASLGLHEEAAAQFEALLEVDPYDVEAHYRAGRSLEELGRTWEAVPHYQRVADLDPASVLAEKARRSISSSGKSRH